MMLLLIWVQMGRKLFIPPFSLQCYNGACKEIVGPGDGGSMIDK